MAQNERARRGTPDFYREKAKAMLKRAEDSVNPETKAAFLVLADHWHRLALQAENPNW